jgi:hypothetical protein
MECEIAIAFLNLKMKEILENDKSGTGFAG